MLLLLVMPLLAWAGDDNDMGMWYSVSVEKKLPRQWNLGVETELRTDNNARTMDRWNLDLSTKYKVNKYLKLGAGYSFMLKYSPDKRKEHYKDDIVDVDHWNGYKTTDSEITPCHRAFAEGTASMKFFKWLRISVRERYQFTYKCPTQTDVTKMRYGKYEREGQTLYYIKEGYPEAEVKKNESEYEHILRSRLKLEVDKKHLHWNPFVSVEFHNALGPFSHDVSRMALQKIRTAAGTGYKIGNGHELSLSYIMTQDREGATHEYRHAINVGYNFEF